MCWWRVLLQRVLLGWSKEREIGEKTRFEEERRGKRRRRRVWKRREKWRGEGKREGAWWRREGKWCKVLGSGGGVELGLWEEGCVGFLCSLLLDLPLLEICERMRRRKEGKEGGTMGWRRKGKFWGFFGGIFFCWSKTLYFF